jgi:transposase
MYRDVAQWHEIRSRILERGTPKKQVARDTGISRHTINKMLMHENPPSHGPRRYPKLGPYISAIDQLVRESASSGPKADLTTRDIVGRLRREHGFAGSRRLVSNYIRNCDDDNVWEKAYDLIVRLPKTRALDLIRLLPRGNPSILMSARLRPFALEAALPRRTPSRPDRELQRLADIEWMRRVLQKEISDATLDNELNGIPHLGVLLKHLRNGRLPVRNRAMVVLANQRNVPSKTICAFLGVSKTFVRRCRKIFDSGSVDTLFARQSKSNRKIDNEQLRNAVFSLLHEPPANYGINRTSWTMSLLSQMLEKDGTRLGVALISKMIKAAGYKLRKAKVVLTSNDPNYREKLAHIHSILSNLKSNEAFFSIDEYDPFAIKTKPGRMLVQRGTQPTVPQWQKSRGCMIMTAALELSGNQVTHFYSAKKRSYSCALKLTTLRWQMAVVLWSRPRRCRHAHNS